MPDRLYAQAICAAFVFVLSTTLVPAGIVSVSVIFPPAQRYAGGPLLIRTYEYGGLAVARSGVHLTGQKPFPSLEPGHREFRSAGDAGIRPRDRSRQDRTRNQEAI